MPEITAAQLNLHGPVAVGGVVAAAYLWLAIQRRRAWFTIAGGLIAVVLVGAVTMARFPYMASACEHARQGQIRQTLTVLRLQIENYMRDHHGQAPLMFRGRLPQLLESTNAQGVPGAPGEDHPYGPYFRESVPANPLTRVATITLIESRPPQAPSGVGGWLYHQETGWITADLAGHLDQ